MTICLNYWAKQLIGKPPYRWFFDRTFGEWALEERITIPIRCTTAQAKQFRHIRCESRSSCVNDMIAATLSFSERLGRLLDLGHFLSSFRNTSFHSQFFSFVTISPWYVQNKRSESSWRNVPGRHPTGDRKQQLEPYWSRKTDSAWR